MPKSTKRWKGLNEFRFIKAILGKLPEPCQSGKVDDRVDNSEDDVEEGHVEGREKVEPVVLLHPPDHQSVDSNGDQTPNQAPDCETST